MIPDRILIERLELSSFIGATEAERATAQRLTVSLVLQPIRGFSGLGDALENTVNYSLVCHDVKAMSLARPRCLIETLAEDLAAMLLGRFALQSVEIELHKYIYPDTAFVAVALRRERSAHQTEK